MSIRQKPEGVLDQSQLMALVMIVELEEACVHRSKEEILEKKIWPGPEFLENSSIQLLMLISEKKY